VRVTAQLIDVETDQALWAETYERDFQDLLVLQSEVARAVAREIEVAVTPEETTRLASARPVNPEAHEAYLKGRVYWSRLTPQDLQTALEYFHLALEKDTNYAPAHTGIAAVWAARAQYGLVLPHDAYAEAKAATTTALELDDTLAEAHDLLATILTWYEWDWPAAEREFRRAIDLNPNYAHTRAFYSLLLTWMGRPQEGRAQIERALELDPFNSLFQALLAKELVWQRQYDEAISQARKVLSMQPGSPDAHGDLAKALYKKGMHEEELAERRESLVLAGYPEVVEALDRGYAEGGYSRAMYLASETLAARSQRAYVPSLKIAQWYALAKENDLALDWLERAYEDRAPQLVAINVDPDWDGLRDDPRFQDLLRRMNLPE
jgi:Tfp pilus assembly protein PilF